MCTKEQALQILSEAYERCQVLYEGRVCDAYLYGSYARGDFHAESDVDIFLSVDMDDRGLCGAQSALSHINSDLSLTYDITVSINAEPAARFRQYSDALAYYRNVKREGIHYHADGT